MWLSGWVASSEDTNSVDPALATLLKTAWAKVAADAKSYIDALQQTVSSKATSAVASHQVLAAKFSAIPKVPCSQHEIRLHKLAAAHGCDVLYTAAVTASSPPAFALAASK